MLAAAAAAVATPTPFGGTSLYQIPEISDAPRLQDIPGFSQELGDVTLKPEDYQVFAKLFMEVDEDELSHEEIQERRIAALLLKIKNSTPPIRRTALKQITEKVIDFFFNSYYPNNSLITEDYIFIPNCPNNPCVPNISNSLILSFLVHYIGT